MSHQKQTDFLNTTRPHSRKKKTAAAFASQNIEDWPVGTQYEEGELSSKSLRPVGSAEAAAGAEDSAASADAGEGAEAAASVEDSVKVAEVVAAAASVAGPGSVAEEAAAEAMVGGLVAACIPKTHFHRLL